MKYRIKLFLIFYLYEKEIPVIEQNFLLSSLWEPSEEDWEKIVNKIKKGNAHNLSEGDTMYLGACTKGSSSKLVSK
jgi:DNA mismatch repair protein MutH